MCDVARKGEDLKIIFNDASELSVQAVRCEGDYLTVLSLIDPSQLRHTFEDPVKTKKIQAKERGQITAEYEGHTEFYRTEEYTGGIYGIVMYKPGKTPEEKAVEMEKTVEANVTQITDLQMAICEIYEGMVM